MFERVQKTRLRRKSRASSRVLNMFNKLEQAMNPTLATYTAYVLISVGLTVWVARTLFTNGRVFLVDVFGNEELADSVNHLLVVGFYLVNFGFVSLALKLGARVVDATESGGRPTADSTTSGPVSTSCEGTPAVGLRLRYN